jgi:cellulose synthase/poly-beta-1,6-N-acetylglucosamine synthase-like glycosyltransferase
LTALRFSPKDPVPLREWDRLPFVTIQLPVYNERFVIRRLIASVSQIEYPRELLEIQVLDDSTDDTTEIAQNAVNALKAKGHNIELLHRVNRQGFKAGALSEGLSKAKGEFIAVFDADFLPDPDFLRRTIHYFSNDAIGMVQARWAHQNPDESLLTRLQRVLIDGHFLVDQFARFSNKRFFNFNGSAGVWRKATIHDAGGWQADTLAEDLDLSYRAQLKGWKFILLSEYRVKQELPRDISAFKQQQFRWTKGSLQVARKMLLRILRSQLPLRIKLEAFLHLTNTVVFLFVVFSSILMLPLLFMPIAKSSIGGTLLSITLLVTGIGSLTLYYIIAQKREFKHWLSKMWFLPVFIAGIAGFSLVYLKALWEVAINKKTPFIRTPKRGDLANLPGERMDYHIKFDAYFLWEIAMGIYLTIILYFIIAQHRFDMIVFLTLMLSGYYYVIFTSLKEALFLKGERSSGVPLNPV